MSGCSRFGCSLAVVAGLGLSAPGGPALGERIPSPPREFRAAWVATVANIDWPSQPGLPVEQQKQEAIVILDKCKELNLNAVVLQVRPQADALYASELEPWSFFLTGKQGQPPEPFYDPLAFWVQESHARGIELHTWLNPYRANHPSHTGPLAENSIVKAHPELVVKLGDRGYYWMDPALKEVQDHSIAVAMDVLRRYDIDGIHFDDYFYPYREYHDGKDFPDDKSWAAYVDSGGTMSRNDWRRSAVNMFIERLYREMKAAKPWVKLGISPFGIWRPGHPPGTTSGIDQYDVLYADVRLWFNEGWLDYMTPQLYWPISRIPQSYPVLLNWWVGENTRKRALWPGLIISNADREGAALEAINQIMITRGMVPDGPGNVFFSMKHLVQNRGNLATMLAEGVYAKQALAPAMPWLGDSLPFPPRVRVRSSADGLEVSWQADGDKPATLWVLYLEREGSWDYEILPGSTLSAVRPLAERPITRVAVSAVDRVGNQGPQRVVAVTRRGAGRGQPPAGAGDAVAEPAP